MKCLKIPGKLIILNGKWAKHVNYEILYDECRENIRAWMTLPKEERNQHTLMKVTQRILDAKDEFLKNALVHNCAFLPSGVELNVTVQFTAFVPPFAFAMEDIVIDVASKYWKGNPEHILNLLVDDRDVNAARNLLHQSTVGVTGSNAWGQLVRPEFAAAAGQAG